MVRYVHCSEDSTDIDVLYIIDELPDFQTCKNFCDMNPDGENRNLAVIRDGVITECYKGSPDELNNALIDTYTKHEQKENLLITKRVPRIKPVKYARAVRIILSHLSRSQYRPEIKAALHGSWSERLRVLGSTVDLNKIDFSALRHVKNEADVKKVIAFQIGQVRGLINDIELYTKREISDTFPELEEFLYRKPDSDINILDKQLKLMATLLSELDTEDLPDNTVLFKDENLMIDLKNESIV
jgi:hypothetical protein